MTEEAPRSKVPDAPTPAEKREKIDRGRDNPVAEGMSAPSFEYNEASSDVHEGELGINPDGEPGERDSDEVDRRAGLSLRR